MSHSIRTTPDRAAAARLAGHSPRIVYEYVPRTANDGEDLAIPSPPRPMFPSVTWSAGPLPEGDGRGTLLIGGMACAGFLYAVAALAGLAE